MDERLSIRLPAHLVQVYGQDEPVDCTGNFGPLVSQGEIEGVTWLGILCPGCANMFIFNLVPQLELASLSVA